MTPTDPGLYPPGLSIEAVTSPLSSSEREAWPIALQDLPSKFTSYRDNQISAINQIIKHYINGAKVVLLDAPPGSGDRKSVV